jgi:RNA polymerase sigma-54 factor
MRFDTSQQMRLGQHVRLAPRMIQSMEILQMPLMELQERIEQELESNIALEQATEGEDELAVAPGEEQATEEDTRPAGERELVVGDDERDFERLNEFEATYGDAADNQFSTNEYTPVRSDGERDRKMDAMANTAARGEGFTEQLLHQWSFADVSDDVARVGRIIIQNINEDGFLSSDLESLLEQHRHVPAPPGAAPLTLNLLEESLEAVQSHLDPAGVGARTQRECLLLQVDRFSADSENEHDWADVATLIAHHFDDLVQNRLPKIEQKSGLSRERIRDAMALMKRLKLHPGRELVQESAPPVFPDVIIEYEESSDSYVSRLADGVLPLLRISTEAERLAKDKALDKETREFAANGIRSASWLIDAISQRRTTLLRVVNVVLARQRDYFDYGPQHLKPLPMTEVADQLGVHVATVSRAVSDKWLQTPRGMVPLRSFFSGGSVTDSGEEVSWQAVKAQLKEIIDGEDKANPLSDDALAKALKEKGIDLARRTVVKYRQQLGIPPARLRKVH